jgi:FHA domain-containing protein
MPSIRVISRMGRPLAAPLRATFGPAGGTLGRSPDCTLALPDENRHISRQQARIDVAAGVASITCLSAANPLIVNGQALRQGQSLRLSHGDRLQVAEYELCFEDGAPGTPAGSVARATHSIGDVADPFADPFADPLGDPSTDALSGPSGAVAVDPMAPGSPSPASSWPASPIPDEFDPFAPDHGLSPGAAVPGGPAPAGTSDPLGLGLSGPQPQVPAGRAESIDALFGLEGGVDPLGPDSPLGRPPGAQPPPGREERFAAGGAAMADDASVLSGSFRLPRAIPPTAFDPPAEPVVSWQQGPARDEAAGGDAASVLARALLQGLGMDALPSGPGPAGAPALSPELLRRLGELLAEASHGTVALLQARATLKQQLRADVTTVGARDNNPLKFAPDGQAALHQLLSPRPVRGFMEPQLAMREAYDDLLAHQVGYVAGMRAAMQGLIERFDPATLEARLASRSMLDTMLPAARKARLWELFNSLYAEVSREAEDEFERLFGRAFMQAYEEQIARIEAARSRQSGGLPRASEGNATGRRR